MDNHIEKVIDAFAEDVLVLAQLILEDNSVDSDNLSYKTSVVGDSVIIQTLFPEYVGYIEWNRPKNYGKMPPISALRDWALRKGIPTDNGTLFLIARAIQRDGHQGRPIFATLERKVGESFEKDWGDPIIDTIIYELNKYFN